MHGRGRGGETGEIYAGTPAAYVWESVAPCPKGHSGTKPLGAVSLDRSTACHCTPGRCACVPHVWPCHARLLADQRNVRTAVENIYRVRVPGPLHVRVLISLCVQACASLWSSLWHGRGVPPNNDGPTGSRDQERTSLSSSSML